MAIATPRTNALPALRMRAFLYEQRHEYSKAIDDYSAILAQVPRDLRARQSRALCYHYIQEFDLAQADMNVFQRQIELNDPQWVKRNSFHLLYSAPFSAPTYL